MTVFVSQQPVPNRYNWMPDLGAATKYGKLHFIFQGEEQPHSSPQASLIKTVKTLQNFDPNEDYLLWPNTGDPVAMWCAIIALTRRDFDHIRFLLWHRPRGNRSGYYDPLEFNLTQGD